MEEFKDVRVDTSMVTLEKWDGCCWLFSDGSALAVNHGGHWEGETHHTGDPKLGTQDFARQHRAVHVGASTWAYSRPTQAQKAALVTLSEFSHVGDSLDWQGWKVKDKGGGAGWAL